jgi:hypothetical protein
MTSVVILIILLALGINQVASQKSLTKSVGPPSFFLQDTNDGLCLAGNSYKRCGVDTLWYVTGKPGSYLIHRKVLDDDEIDQCLVKSNCHTDASEINIASCTHCGAKKWNILGDSDTGLYVFIIYNTIALHCIALYRNNSNNF